MRKTRVKLEGGDHSTGRGVGFYTTNLKQALTKSGKVEFVDSDPDLIHYPYFDLFYSTLKLPNNIPVVVTVHDLTPLILGSLYPQGVRGKLNLLRQTRKLRKVSAILTDSKSSKKDICTYFNLSSSKVFVTPLAVSEQFKSKVTISFKKSIKEKYSLPDKFILYVGGVNANKNLVRLAKAAIELKTPLVLVGSEFIKQPLDTFSFKKALGFQKTHPEVQEFKILKKIISNNPLFLTPGFVPTDELNAIYKLASVYCQPSLYEGFGLPLLEAMTAGCLIASANTGSLPELYPQGTLSFSPYLQQDVNLVINKALKLSQKEKDEKIKASLKRSKDFSWDKTAQLTIDVYKHSLKN